ncbi:MAG: MBOAT family protein [Verrucomicrobiota bacterium]
MEFGSIRFFLLLTLTLIALRVVAGLKAKKVVILIASCAFYAAWDWRYLGLLLLIGAINHALVLYIDANTSKRVRYGGLSVAVVFDLLVLGYFKYANFFLDTLNGFLAKGSPASPLLQIVLPVGISFYIFKLISYAVDVHRRQIEPCRTLLDFLTFLTFFPELIAGPIVRASVFLPQLSRDVGFDRKRFASGASQFAFGAVKKFFIADHLAIIADATFSDPSVWSTGTMWCGVIAYSIQIYCDFSGYSDMAIGTARIIGYDLPENFNMPYLARNIAEFWRRWHMSLSQWLRDYLYIPLGGNRRGEARTYINLFLTMLIGGLWHGASWNFVVWGGLHGLALAVHRLWSRGRSGASLFPAWLGVVSTALFVTLAWVPFRASSWEATLEIWRKLFFGAPSEQTAWHPFWLWPCLALVVIGHVIGSRIFGIGSEKTDGKLFDVGYRWLGLKPEANAISGPVVTMSRVTVGGVFCAMTAIILLLLFMPLTANPFIYFQF